MSSHFFTDTCISRRHWLVFLFPRRSNKNAGRSLDFTLTSICSRFFLQLSDRQISKNNQIRRRHLIEEEKKTGQRLSPRRATSSLRFRQISTRVDYIFDVFPAMRICLVAQRLIIEAPIDLFLTRSYHDGSLHRLINHSLKLFFLRRRPNGSLSEVEFGFHDDYLHPTMNVSRVLELTER